MSPIGDLARQDEYDLPDVGLPLLSPGPQVSPGLPAVNRAADVLSRYPGHVMGSLASLPERAFGASEEMRAGGDYNPAPAVEAALATMGTGGVAGVPVRGAETALGAGPIRAYHSSPHDFDKFDLSKIGTGEGAQVYGHGLYFAENPAVSGRGGEYWKHFANRGSSGENTATEYLARAGFDREKAAQTLRDLLANPPAYTSGYNKMTQERMRQEALQLLESDKHIGPRTYEVDINADPAHFVDWDKPLYHQPRKVMDIAYPKVDPAELDLSDLHNVLRTQAVTKDLAAAGIPGIKYLDQGSRNLNVQMLSPSETTHGQWVVKHIPNGNVLYRGADEAAAKAAYAAAPRPSSNYVVFNPGLIDIRRKYGIPAAAATGAMGALAAQDNYQQ